MFFVLQKYIKKKKSEKITFEKTRINLLFPLGLHNFNLLHKLKTGCASEKLK